MKRIVVGAIALALAGCATLREPASFVDSGLHPDDATPLADAMMKVVEAQIPIGPSIVYLEPSGVDPDAVGPVLAGQLRDRGYAIAAAVPESKGAERFNRLRYVVSPLDEQTVLLRFSVDSRVEAAQLFRRGPPDNKLAPASPMTVRKD